MEIITAHAKAWAAVLAAVLAAVVPAIAVDGPLTFADWVNIVILAAGALQVYNASNGIPGWPYAKMIAAIASAVAVTVLSAWSDGTIGRSEWIQIGISALGAFVVYRLPNTTAAASTGRHSKVE